jgi:hypothetical protein
MPIPTVTDLNAPRPRLTERDASKVHKRVTRSHYRPVRLSNEDMDRLASIQRFHQISQKRAISGAEAVRIAIDHCAASLRRK